MHSAIKSNFEKVINFLLPPQCPKCKEITAQPYTLCNECWPELEFITSPKCSVCSIPLSGVDQDMPCESCLVMPPLFEKAAAPLVYNDILKVLILRFKNYDALNYTPMFVKWMLRCAPQDCDLMIPVPLHWKRFFMRQYNQSAELIKELNQHTKIPFEFNILKRIKATPSQGYKKRLERYENIKDAFAINDKNSVLKGKKILLVDDVLTSGATVNACAKILKQHGAKSVSVLTVARVPKEHYKERFKGDRDD